MQNLIIISNSTLGQKGNIGFRYFQILKLLTNSNLRVSSISRGNAAPVRGVKQISSQLMLYSSRALNGLRIYIFRNFNHKAADNFLFRILCRLGLFLINSSEAVILCSECDPKLISLLKRKSKKVVLDIPIAPQSYLKNVLSSNPQMKLNYHFDMDESERRAISLADEIICPSQFVAEEVRKISPHKKISIINFGCNTECDVSKHSNIQEKIKFCFAGNINARKGVDLILEAFKDQRFRNDELHLCGRIYPEFKKILKESGSNVKSPGFVDTKTYFPSCDVYIFPSWMEGSSKSIFEAMVAGLPVITTYSSGSVIQNEIEGFIIPQGDVEALKEKMLFFKNNPGAVRIMGQSARKTAEQYTWERYAKNVIQLLIEDV